VLPQFEAGVPPPRAPPYDLSRFLLLVGFLTSRLSLIQGSLIFYSGKTKKATNHPRRKGNQPWRGQKKARERAALTALVPAPGR
jgi:hypothetical protein